MTHHDDTPTALHAARDGDEAPAWCWSGVRVNTPRDATDWCALLSLWSSLVVVRHACA